MKTRDSCTCSASPIFAVAYCGESKSQNRTISCTTTMHRKRQTWTRLGTVRMMLVEQIDTASSPHPVHPPGCCAIHQPGRAPIGPSTRVAVARRPAGPSVPTSAQIDTATHHPPAPPLQPNIQPAAEAIDPPNPSPAGTLHGWADGMCPAAAPTALSRGSDGRHVCGLPALSLLSCEIGIPNNGRAAGAAAHAMSLLPDAVRVRSPPSPRPNRVGCADLCARHPGLVV